MGNSLLQNLAYLGLPDPTKKKFRDHVAYSAVCCVYGQKNSEVACELPGMVDWMHEAEDKLAKCVYLLHIEQGLPLAEIAKKTGMTEYELGNLLADPPSDSEDSDYEDEEEEEKDEEWEEQDEENDEEGNSKDQPDVEPDTDDGDDEEEVPPKRPRPSEEKH